MSQGLIVTGVYGLGVPFAVALAAAALAGAVGWRRDGLAVALGLAAGAWAGQAAVTGGLALIPAGAVDKLPYLALAGLALGLLVARAAGSRAAVWGVPGVLALAVVWLGWPRLAVPQTAAWLAATLVWAGGLWSLARLREAPAARAGLMAGLAVVALAGVGLYASSYRMAALIAVLAAALAGACLGGALPGVGQRGGFGPVARVGMLLPGLGLVTLLALYTAAAPLALGLLGGILWADRASGWLAARLPGVVGPAEGGGRLLWTLALGLVPAVLAVWTALRASGPLYY